MTLLLRLLDLMAQLPKIDGLQTVQTVLQGGLQALLPLINEALLKIPKLLRIFYSSIRAAVMYDPDILLSLPAEALTSVAQHVASGAQCHSTDEVRRLSLETITTVASRRLTAAHGLNEVIARNAAAFCGPVLQLLMQDLLRDPRGWLAVLETLSDAMLALILVEEGTVKGIIEVQNTHARGLEEGD